MRGACLKRLAPIQTDSFFFRQNSTHSLGQFRGAGPRSLIPRPVESIIPEPVNTIDGLISSINRSATVFERYTEKARRVIFFARYEASQFGSLSIEPEHILLGLLREDTQLVQHLFPNLPAAVQSIRKEIEQRIQEGEKVPASVDLPLSPQARRAL